MRDMRADEVQPGDILLVKVVDVGKAGPEGDIRLVLDPNVPIRVAPYVEMAVIR